MDRVDVSSLREELRLAEDESQQAVIDKAVETIKGLRKDIRKVRIVLSGCAGCWTIPDCDDCPLPAVLRELSTPRERGK